MSTRAAATTTARPSGRSSALANPSPVAVRERATAQVSNRHRRPQSTTGSSSARMVVSGLSGWGGRGGCGGSTASLRLIGLTVVLATAFLALTASSALAARGHVESSQVIGKPCTELVCGAEELKEPSALAVNEATNRIYVLDQGDDRVLIFNAETGAQVGEFDGSATPAGSFQYPAAPQNAAIAVDNSCALHEPPLTGSACEALDPSAGDVYVADSEHLVVDQFQADGTYTGTQIKEPLEGEGLEGVAVDPEGTLWVYRERPAILGFRHGSPTEPVGPELRPQPPASNAFGSPGFAVDSAGAFYGRLRIAGVKRIAKWSHAGTIEDQQLGGLEEANAVAVDQGVDSAFADTDTALRAYSPTGTELESFEFGGGLGEAAGIGIDHASGFAYLVDRAAGRLRVLEPTQPGPPKVEAADQFVSGVTSSEAELHSALSPQSEEGEEPTTYRFAYGPCPSLASCASAPYPFRTLDATLAADFAAHPVSAAIAGLSPGTTYHYLLVAENEHEGTIFTTEGPESTFTTQPLGALVLPDSRQWEMVSPPDKLGASIEPISESGVLQAAASGGAITYLTNAPVTPDPAGYANREQILSTRTAAGWSTRDIGIPHAAATGAPVGPGPEYKFFSPDLAGAAVHPFGPFNPGLSPEASEQTPYLHDLSGACGAHCFRPLVSGREGFENVPPGTEFGEDAQCEPSGEKAANARCGPEFRGATEDLSHVVLSSTVPLATGMPAGALYGWSAGALSPISLLPDGEGIEGSLGLGNQAARGAISADGSRVAWEKTNEALYLRLNATEPPSTSGACDEAGRACTIQLDAPTTGTGTSGGGQFQFMSADGSRVFFTDTQPLTEDSGASPSFPKKADLYECRVVEPAPGHLACDLADLTPKTETPGEEPAAVQGSILGAGQDGSSVYLVADGILASNTVDNGAGPESAQVGRPNLYLLEDGATTFIAALSGGDGHDWSELLQGQPTRVSANGRFLKLMSRARPTGYDNRDRATGAPVAEVYLYDAAAGRLRCASCDPTGARPIGFDYQQLEPGSGGLVGGGRGTWLLHGLVAAIVPGWTQIRSAGPVESRYQPRYLNNSGRLFFNAGDGLVPQDSNGTFDVYEYEPPQGPGQPASNNCSTASPTYSERSGGCVSLISSGTSKQESAFLDASESGDDVFILTYSRLAKADTDAALDVYDAHDCSAAAPCLPEPPAPPPACQGDACQSPAVPPNDQTPASLTNLGASNVFECPKGKAKKHGKCVKTHHKKKHHKKHKKAHKRHGNSKRGAGR